MASTPLLGLSLPADGTTNWGTLVNTSITALLDSAVAGTTTLTTDADVTLSATTEAANESRQAIILWKPLTGTVTRNITAPAQSKTYVVINATGGTQSIVFRGAGLPPTTGVTIPAGKAYMLAWNGADFITTGVTTVNLATDVTGTLGVGNGGTGQTTYTDGQLLIGNSTGNTLTKATLTGGTGVTITNGAGAITINGTTYGTATTTVNGLIKLGDGTVQTTAANTVSADANRTYAIQLNGSGQAVVNVPWTSGSGGVSSISFASTGLTPSTATTGAVTVGGTLGVGNGGTNLSSYTTNAVLYASGTNVLANSSNFVFNGTQVGILNSSPAATLDVGGSSIIGSTSSGSGITIFRRSTIPTSGSTFASLNFASTTDASTLQTASAIIARATEAWSGSGSGSSLVFRTSTNGVVGPSDKMILGDNGDLSVTGAITSNSVPVVTTTGTQTLSNKTFNTLEIASGYQVTWDSGGASDPYQKYTTQTIFGISTGVMEFVSPGTQYLYARAGTAGAAGLWLAASSGGSGQIGTATNYNLNFYRNQNLYQTFDANGVVLAAGRNLGVGGTTPSTSGAGITFPATQSASSDVNTLDDYEEGTFTPTVYGTTTAGVGTYNAYGQVGNYVKIGNMVKVQIRLSWSAHTGTGDMAIQGLPFNSPSVIGANDAVALTCSGITLTANNVMTADKLPYGAVIQLRQYPAGGGTEANVPIDTSGSIQISCVYLTNT
jgi:hypothetical protein